MKTLNQTFEFQTKGLFDFIDITDKIENFVKESKIQNGLINIQILHTSAALIVNENEPLLIEDFKKNLEMTASQSVKYQHDDLRKRAVNICPGECINGHSHCKAIHLLVNTTLNLINGEIQLGQWQRVLVVELDRSRKRKVQIQVIGV
jgi:secondary thiamine-phosphate synthase enzyme